MLSELQLITESWIVLEKLIVPVIIKKLCTFYGTQKVMYFVCKSLPLCWTRWIQSTVIHSIFLSSILMLSSYLCIDLSSGLFHKGNTTKSLYAFHFICVGATFHARIITFYLLTFILIVAEDYISWSSISHNILHTSDVSSFSDSDIFLSTLFLNIFKPMFLPKCDGVFWISLYIFY